MLALLFCFPPAIVPQEVLKSVNVQAIASTIGFLSLLWKNILEALLVFAWGLANVR
jgi:hypothetical protein